MTAPREVTAETLTDAEIRALQGIISGSVLPASGMAHTELSDLWHDTEDALGQPVVLASGSTLDATHGTWIPNERRRQARERIAAAINARAKAVR